MSNADIESPTPSPPTLTAMAATLYRGGSGYREGYIADLEANDNESEVSDVVIEDDEGGGVYVIYSDGEGRVPNAYYSSQGHLPPEAPGFFGSLFGRAGDAFKRNFLSSVSPLPYSLSVLLSDLKAAATVSLVSLPLSIALSIAGGGLPAQGIISAFWAGTFAAALGGSEWNIVGPTGALSGLLMALSVCCGGPGVLPLLAIEAALMVFAVWALDLAKYLMFIPSAVIEGFTAGVAAIIVRFWW